MTRRKNQTITMEMFEDALLPRIEEVFEEKLKKYQIEVVGFKEEVLGEIKGLRDEVKVTLNQYKRTNNKVDNISKHLNLPI
jgi:hypothetical protein